MIWLSGGCLMIAIFDLKPNPLNGVSIFSGFYRESPKPTFNGRRLSGLPENVPKPSIPVFRRNCKWDVRTWKFIFRISPVRISGSFSRETEKFRFETFLNLLLPFSFLFRSKNKIEAMLFPGICWSVTEKSRPPTGSRPILFRPLGWQIQMAAALFGEVVLEVSQSSAKASFWCTEVEKTFEP